MKKRTCILTALTIFTLALAGCGSASGNNSTSIPNDSASGNQMNADSPTENSSGSEITEEEAKSIALTDAGIKEDEVTNIRIQKDIDDGISVYDVDFYVENKEYDYEIDATSGKIHSQDSEIEDDFLDQKSTSDSTDSADVLSEEEASKIVLAKVEGATAQNLRISLDRDNGQDVYEGEIRYNGMEYEFELNAKTGDILEWSKEREDD